MAEMPDSHPEGSGRNSRAYGMGASSDTATGESSRPEAMQLMEAVVERKNMTAAWRRVQANKGAAGVDGMTVDELLPYLRQH